MKKYKFLLGMGLPNDGYINRERLTVLEEDINSEAKDGWKVISCTESNVLFRDNEMYRLLVLLEKDE